MLIDEPSVRRRRTVLERQTAVGATLGVLGLTLAVQELLGAAEPATHRSPAVAGAGTGLALLVASVAWRWYRERRLVALEEQVPVRIPPIPPPPPPGQVGGTPPRGTDWGWWFALVGGTGAGVFLVVRLVTMLGGPRVRWTTAAEALVLVAWIVVVAAMLRTRPTADTWPDPADGLDPSTRRRFTRALGLRRWGVVPVGGPSRTGAVTPDLVPTARAALVRAVHHRRRMTWVGAAASLVLLDGGLRELPRGDGAALSIGLGLFGVVCALVELQTRRRAAARLATLGAT